ncbi:uncharacterized protein LOC121530289 [Drosophila eugracilis]|uniref:uncharacterized protein LOC121530289 n=1 Tax=Drosophila eugracilis TaxID=29029 RepID=UPI001BD91ECC|nr:uncharacterized protein LOC121530289 [Drosophila eugracilis]
MTSLNWFIMLLRNDQRLKRDPPHKVRYDSVIQEYIDLGHITEVSPMSSSATYYLPHHPVFKPESTTTKDIWLLDLGDDDALPQDFCQRWVDFLKNYTVLDQIRVTLWVAFRPHLKGEHFGCCDVSQKAYGAFIYVRVEVGLLTAKTRVAPVKTVSLPRLELCGALLLSEMATAVLPEWPGAASAPYCWTDSTIVLAWPPKPACQ